LLSVYKNIYVPFLANNKAKLERNSEWMSRFFFITGHNITDGTKFGYKHYVGKSFVNLKTSKFMIVPHFPRGDRYDVDYNYVSHFRKRYSFGKDDKSIRLLNFDFNFFICYVSPLIN